MSEASNQGVRVYDRFHLEHRFTPQQVTDFSLAAGDVKPLRIDAAHAAASPFGPLIVSGTHTTALPLGLTASYSSKFKPVVGRLFTVQFTRAVRADAVVMIEWRVVASIPRAGSSGQVVSLDGELPEAVSDEVWVTGTEEVEIGF